MTSDEALRTIQTFNPAIVAVRLVPPRRRRQSDGHRLPEPAGVRLLMPGLDPILLRTDGVTEPGNEDSHAGR